MSQLNTGELTFSFAGLHSLAPRVLKIWVPFISALPEPSAAAAAASGFRRLDGLAAFGTCRSDRGGNRSLGNVLGGIRGGNRSLSGVLGGLRGGNQHRVWLYHRMRGSFCSRVHEMSDRGSMTYSKR